MSGYEPLQVHFSGRRTSQAGQRSSVTAFAALLLLLAQPAMAQRLTLFSQDVGQSIRQVAAQDPAVVRQRETDVDLTSLRETGRADGLATPAAARSIVLNLFRDAEFTAVPDRIELVSTLGYAGVDCSSAPGAPGGLTITQNSGGTVAFSWSAASGEPTTYYLEAGSAPGLANLANTNLGGTATTFATSGVGVGTYYVRVRAANACGTGSASNEVVLIVTGAGGCTAPPGAPSGLTITKNSGGNVAFSWSAALGGPTTYLLEAGSAPGLANLANSDLAGIGTTFATSGVGLGTYYVRVRAANACGPGSASNEVVLIVTGADGCTAPPDAPSSLTITQNSGGSVAFDWSAALGGAMTYVLEAGSAPGLANLVTVDVGSTTAFTASGVSAGTFYVRVRAANACGTGKPSNQVVLVVGTPASVCTGVSISPTGVTPDSRAGSQTVTVTGIPAGCTGGTWTASGNGSWITVFPPSGSGPGTVTVSWARSTDTLYRSGDAIIAGRRFTVIQMGTSTPRSKNYFGIPVAAAGDVNGDGYGDVVVGSEYYGDETGRAYVYLGRRTGLESTATTVLTGEAIGNHFGWAAATAGDVNGDGYADIVVGAFGYGGDAGRAYVYQGGQAGVATTPSTTLTSEAVGSAFGYAVATAGDVNGDGYADVVVGAPWHNASTGRVYVFLGGASGLSLTPAVTLTGEGMNNWFGRSVSTAGDVNRDGYADVIVGASGHSSGAGRAYVYLGGPTGVATTAATILSGEASSSWFGHTVGTAGDVNRDGYDDVLVGAWGFVGYTGRAYLYLGGPTGVAETAATILTGEATSNEFGGWLGTVGDVNGDGYADVGVGAPAYGGVTGRAYLYLGGASGLAATPHRILTGAAPGDTFGYPVASLGDVNGDGYADVGVGASGFGGSSGRAYVYFGGQDGLVPAPATTLTSEEAYGDACTSAPGAPSGLTITQNGGGSVAFTWSAALGGPTTYVLEAGSAPGLANLANIDLWGTGTAFATAGVGAGTYYVRVRAANACGKSGASNEVVLVMR